MRTNLSSQIVLYQVPKKYYQPDSALEMSGISRLEKIKTHITTTSKESSEIVAQEIANLIRQKAKENKKCVICFTSGRSPIELFNELVRMHDEENLSFQNVIIFNLFEYYPLDVNFAQSCLNQIKSNLLDKVDILPENIHSIDPTLNQSDIAQYCIDYERQIEECGGKLPLKRYPPTSPHYIKGCMNNGILEIMNLVGLELRLLKLKRNGDMII